ncbi:hypothetical protein ACFC1D_29330 [Streptomyces vinaceus]|uniref:hypothetical protein n=1 Tax=Streptomyces vinaceus TaxID=1960 RepID=UPI0035E3109E
MATVFASAGHAHQVMANGAGTLLRAAEDFVRQNSEIAASFLDQSPAAPGIGPQPSGPDCNQRASHKAEDLPEVVGETSWTDQYLLDKRFHGQRDKLRKTAAVWNSAAAILEDAYWDSGTAWKTATTHQQGETATAVEDFFKLFVGKTPPPSEVGPEETLMANLPTACRMIAKACEAYADHVETASRRIPEESNPSRVTPCSPGTAPALAATVTTAGCTSWSPATCA